MKVAVCVITYQRPRGLKALLESLNQLSFDRHPSEVEVVVVDNDTQGAARRVCDEVGPHFRWRLQTFEEPRRGIPFARNKAVASAPSDAEFIAFVDDDETVESNWLDELLNVQRTYEADVVTGPIVPRFMEDAPTWILEGRFYERRRHATGASLDRAFTNNVIFRAGIFAEMAPIFDERLALTGGSDAHFSRRVHRAGYKIVWADHAAVYEWIPTSRVGAKWILQRAYRVGTATSFIDLDILPGKKAVLRLLLRAGLSIAKGTFSLPLVFVNGKRGLILSMRSICFGAGMLAGLTGRQYQEYRRTHGA